MSDVVLSIENVSKQYRLGKVGVGTLSHDLNRWWHTVRGKEDPFLKIGEANDRTTKGSSEYVWSLKDINFEVKRGEALGIIGRNGAGKSTLLKILSQVTGPTTGTVRAKGRIASLLEVGTGFHPDLSGRENIFLNGAILGMRKSEIRAKFDEIVAFSGVERYIDTPVKRYSSGMYVRLAFAVAAHLEPEILIVDEVLAVGDAEFQKKCLGKMKDVSGEGRTVLFVSHNMASINQLCNKGLLLQNGKVAKQGKMSDVIPYYLSNSNSANELISEVYYEDNAEKKFQVISARILNQNNDIVKSQVSSTDEIYFEIKYRFKEDLKKCNLTLVLQNSLGETVWFIDRTDYYKEFFVGLKGEYITRIKIPNPLLKPGQYIINIGFGDTQSTMQDHKFFALKFEINGIEALRENRPGVLFLPVEWEMRRL